ncbi:hypothetical protein WG901_22295 [Novosphingobium sp. PS1R-30]|uniref:Uncharacterized protein n=1 Tax=Novosphingobium anseongense TaxID=3133436 RepID=A0ABU8S3E5_9SPHN
MDLVECVAAWDAVVIRFFMSPNRDLEISCILADDFNLEDQCEMAGEAIDAIKRKLLRSF